MKRCSRCGIAQPEDSFYRSRPTLDGLHHWCKSCSREDSKKRRGTPQAYIAQRARQLLRKFSMTIEEYDSMLVSQNGGCAICGSPETRIVKGTLNSLVVDHNHETGVIRGLLCALCNTALGKFHDDPDLLRRAAEYLERPVKAERVGEVA